MYEDIKHGDRKMSFLIFAYRKLSLKRKISDGNFRLMLLDQKLTDKTQQIGELNQAISNGKNMTNIFAQSAMMNLETGFYKDIQEKGGRDKLTESEKATMSETFRKQQYDIMMQSNVANSIFETVSKAQLSQLNAEDKQIEAEKTNLESQLKLFGEELKSVEQGEDAAAKQMAPKFGIT